ncbi:MAG: tyrosine--tRNA ligase, partial [Spirochaetota bacterium]
MAHLQRAGHKAIALVGGGTARIGDPSGRTEMRKMLSLKAIQENTQALKKQIARFIDFEDGKGLLVDNADWLADLNYIEFLRDIGRHFSVNRMLSYETYKLRLETGLSFIEFNYQLLQSYDFLILFKRYGCKLQIGGDDQWGNIVAGADLIRRIEGQEVIGLTFPLVTRADGRKMGKTEQGSLFLDPGMVSPYEFFQYFRNVPDEDVGKFLHLYTFLSAEEIRELGRLKEKEINKAKEILACEVTAIVHGKDEAEKAVEASRAAFNQEGAGKDRSAIPAITLPMEELDKGINVTALFARTSLCRSNSEARRLISQGGAQINDNRINDINLTIDSRWLKDNELLLKAGKKRYFRILAG